MNYVIRGRQETSRFGESQPGIQPTVEQEERHFSFDREFRERSRLILPPGRLMPASLTVVVEKIDPWYGD
jgi:hypothetical protein